MKDPSLLFRIKEEATSRGSKFRDWISSWGNSADNKQNEGVIRPIPPVDLSQPPPLHQDATSPSSPQLADLSKPAPSEPIAFEAYGREVQNVLQQDNFDGFRLEAARPITSRLQANHSLLLGTSLRDCGYFYQFGPTFSKDDGSLVLLARYGTDGVVNGRFSRKIGDGLEVKAQLNSSLKEEQRNIVELGVDNTSKFWTSSMKAIWQGTWILGSSFSQVVHRRVQLGGELMWIASNGASIGSIGARFAGNKDIFTAQVCRQPDFKNPVGIPSNSHSLKFQHCRKVNDRLSLGSEFEYSYPDKESALRLGYEYLFRQARIQGMFDTKGQVSVLAQDFSGFGVSGVIDYWRGDYKFGFVLHMLPTTTSDIPPT